MSPAPTPAPPPVRTRAFWTGGRLGIALGTLAFLAVLGTLGDPGITCDEPLDVRVGRRYVEAIERWAEGRWSPARAADVRAVFADNAQHPPLGRLVLGVASVLFEPVEGLLGGSDPFSVHPARVAPAAAFGVLVGLVTRFAAGQGGTVAGLLAGTALIGFPRSFAHAHFATLDTTLSLTWTAALLSAAGAARSRRPIPLLMLAGLAWGLALLTKIHAWVLPPIVGIYLTTQLPIRRAVLGGLAWLASGFALFMAGWPWLWHDPATHLRGFLGTSVERLPLRVEYFGRVYLDRAVPWHYPWVYFLVTIPVGFLLLGGVGAVRAWGERRRDARPLLLGTSIVLWLVIFSTGAPVYDGERLFLQVFPAWAVLVGLGGAALWERWRRPLARVALGAVVLAQGYGVVALHPFGLSYYNALVGGLPGAERLGMELTYWGDAVDGALLDALARDAAPGTRAALVPTLHHVQASSMLTPELVNRKVNLADQAARTEAPWLVVYRRKAYWPEGLAAHLGATNPRFLNRRQGVWLAGIWPGPAPAAKPAPSAGGIGPGPD